MRTFRIVVFSLGTILGFGFAVHAGRWHGHHRDAFERHVAQICVDAARGVPAPSGPRQP
jgi:hypothetical protein